MGEDVLPRAGLRFWLRLLEVCPCHRTLAGTWGAIETDVADHVLPRFRHMPEQAREERGGRKRHGFVPSVVMILVGEDHGRRVRGTQSGVADRPAFDVARQIAYDAFSVGVALP